MSKIQYSIHRCPVKGPNAFAEGTLNLPSGSTDIYTAAKAALKDAHAPAGEFYVSLYYTNSKAMRLLRYGVVYDAPTFSCLSI